MEVPLETLEGFRARTEAFLYSSLPVGGTLETNPNLTHKVDGQGNLLPFGGNTVVYSLPEPVRRQLARVRAALYDRCGAVLAQPLGEDTFHITLHDLVNGLPSPRLEEEMRSVGPLALAEVERVRAETEPVHMVSTALFNMVNTSMVLGFAPADEASCARLMGYYQRFQRVVTLHYPLTPHVTVAYFRPGRYGPEQVDRLQEAVAWAAAQPPISLALSGAELEYQCFSSMARYWNGATENGGDVHG